MMPRSRKPEKRYSWCCGGMVAFWLLMIVVKRGGSHVKFDVDDQSTCTCRVGIFMNIHPSIHSCRITGKLHDSFLENTKIIQKQHLHLKTVPSPGSATSLREDPNFPTDSLSTRHGTALPFKFLPPPKQTDQQRKHHLPNRFFLKDGKGAMSQFSAENSIDASFEIRQTKTR